MSGASLRIGSILSDFCPDWLPPTLSFALPVLSEPYPASTLFFMKSTTDLIITNVRVDRLLNVDKILPFLLIKGIRRSAVHLRSYKLASHKVPLSIFVSMLMPQSLSLF